jgi:hypothetical protein
VAVESFAMLAFRPKCVSVSLARSWTAGKAINKRIEIRQTVGIKGRIIRITRITRRTPRWKGQEVLPRGTIAGVALDPGDL